MKQGFYGLRGKQIYLILIAFVCTTILIWAWDKTPFLTSLLPPQSRLLQLPPEPHVFTVFEKEAAGQLEGHHSDAETSKDPADGNTGTDVKEVTFMSEGNIAEEEMQKEKHSDASAKMDPAITSVQEKENVTSITKEADSKQGSDGKNSSRVPEIDLVASRSSENGDTSVREDGSKNWTTAVSSKACSYAKGKWVVDDGRPLYSGFGCKQWLSGMWACRLTQRTDFAYEKLRWQPKDCALEDFSGSKFLERMRNKTLAFVGDSLGRQQFQSLMCMATGGKEMPDVIDAGREYGLVKARGAVRPDGWAYWFQSTNTTIIYYWSASLCDLEPINRTNPTTDFAMHLDRPPAFLQRFIHKFDVLVLNTGHHWNRGKFKANRWVMYVGGKPNTKRKLAEIGGAKNFTIYSIVNWVNSQLVNYPGLKVFFRSISPRHFFNGDWDTGGTCDNTSPLSGGKEVLQEESSDPLAASAVKGTNVKLLDVTAISQLRDEGHISRYSIKATPGMQDCLHWCLPGVPDTWNEILFAQL